MRDRQSAIPNPQSAILCAAIVLFVALAYGLGEDNDVFRAYDYREIFRYQKEYYRAALLAGRLPLWTPHTFSGWPFAANPLTQTFYPPALLAVVLPLPLAAVADLLLHLVLAALGTWLLLCRGYRLGGGAAALGALAYSCTGTIVAQAYAGHVPYYAAAAYLPWVLLGADRAVPDPAGSHVEVRWLALAAVALGLQTLSGGLPFVWLTLPLLVLYRAGSLLCRRPRGWRAWGREIVVLGTIGLGGLGLAAVQILPAWELARLSNRAEAGWEYAAQISFPPELLANLAVARASARGHEPFWEFYAYAGVLPLLLATLALWRTRVERRVVVLAAVALLALLFAFGRYGFLFPLLWKYAPGLGLFRGPARALAVTGLVVAMLAAIGLDAAAGALARWTGRRAAAGALVAFAFVCTWTDLLLAARANRERLRVAETPDMPLRVHPAFVAALERDRTWYRYWFPRAYFVENHAYALGARSVGGYDSLHLARYGRFVHHMADTPYSPLLANFLDPRMFLNAATPFPFKVLGVKYAFGKDNSLRPNPDPVRRGWFVTRACRVADERAALAHMRGARFEPYREVVFEAAEADRLAIDDGACAAAPGPAADVRVEEISPEHLRIRLERHPRGFVVLAEIFHPGWHAASGGRNLPILRADSILRAVAVNENDTQIDMTFAPSTLRWGGAVSLACMLLLLFASLAGSGRARRSLSSLPLSAPRHCQA